MSVIASGAKQSNDHDLEESERHRKTGWPLECSGELVPNLISTATYRQDGSDDRSYPRNA
jgi:hypothetical protein